MSLYDKIVSRQEKLSLIGLGYVGLPIAVEFAKKINVIGFDLNCDKIENYKSGIDATREVGDEEITKTSVEFTCKEEKLQEARFHIVAVPTPVTDDKIPDLRPVISASEILGRNLVRGSIVVYESTVYPGVTEEICVPCLERVSGLKCGVDFKVGYSPERINPGDKNHRLADIVKIVSGMDEETLDIIAKVYELVVLAGVHRAESIKVAEAAKVIENSQRDINIAFMNELSIIFDKMNIDTNAVIDAACTKWNFLDFRPGLVGGHCIGVDPYYLTYKADQIGYHSQVILAGRSINDDMGKHVATRTVKNLIKAGITPDSAKVAILGYTFKENCPDTRNTKVKDIIEELSEYHVTTVVCDPVADKTDKVEFVPFEEINDVDAVIIAVSHKEFFGIGFDELRRLFRNKNNMVITDVKGVLDKKEALKKNILYWRL